MLLVIWISWNSNDYLEAVDCVSNVWEITAVVLFVKPPLIDLGRILASGHKSKRWNVGELQQRSSDVRPWILVPLCLPDGLNDDS